MTLLFSCSAKALAELYISNGKETPPKKRREETHESDKVVFERHEPDR